MKRVLCLLIFIVEVCGAVSAVCVEWRKLAGSGSYPACTYFSNAIQQMATFDDTGLLAVRYGIPDPSMVGTLEDTIVWRSGLRDWSSDSVHTLEFSTDGVLSTKKNGIVTWSNIPESAAYPGRPDNKDAWNIDIVKYSLRVNYFNTTIWESMTGPVFAKQVSKKHVSKHKTKLGENQYIQLSTGFILSGLDGIVYRYNGVYPHSTGAPLNAEELLELVHVLKHLL